MPDGIVGIEADKPAEQQVVIELLDQHPLRSNAVNRLQQQGQYQLLGWNRWSASLGVEPADGRVEQI